MESETPDHAERASSFVPNLKDSHVHMNVHENVVHNSAPGSTACVSGRLRLCELCLTCFCHHEQNLLQLCFLTCLFSQQRKRQQLRIVVSRCHRVRQLNSDTNCYFTRKPPSGYESGGRVSPSLPRQSLPEYLTYRVAMSLSDLAPFKDIDGNDIAPSKFKGKVVFVMNVASACGYGKAGYELFAKLTAKYAPKDFLAVAIPCNSYEFGLQERGSPQQIKAFALGKADKLIITQPSHVNGKNEHPIVKLAKTKFPTKIFWNFDGRYVFDRNGAPVARFTNTSTPQAIEAAIDAVL